MKKMVKLLKIVIILLLIATIFKTLNIEKKIMKQLYPIKYSEYVNKYSEKYNVEIYMVYAIIKAESNFDKSVKSNSDAIGLMQVMKATAIETADKIGLQISEEELYEPKINIEIGVKYFSDLLEKYDNNNALAIIAYNAGIGNVDKWIENRIIKEDGADIENVPFKETNNYVRKILRDYEIYKELYK